MFELSNEQRKCFGLRAVKASWDKIKIKSGTDELPDAFVYVDGGTIRKCILSGNDVYNEFEIEENISEDGKHLLPKTPKGKPAPLTRAKLIKRKRHGMCLLWSRGLVDLYSFDNNRSYFTNTYLEKKLLTLKDFSAWVKRWCAETTDEDLAEINEFAVSPLKRVKYHEGDVFRFKIDRRLYGFGRIIADYDNMRKSKTEFWDILLGKALVCSVFQIASEDKNVPIEELKELESLPSCFILDTRFYYGEYEIIGNIPTAEYEDYPIMYGESISFTERNMGRINFQRGKVFKSIFGDEVLDGCENFRNNTSGFNLNVRKDILLECIKRRSNQPYWSKYDEYTVNRDLRNPKFEKQRIAVYAQMGLLIN